MARRNLITYRESVLSRCLAVALAFTLWSGCAVQRPLQESRIGELGRMEYRRSLPDFAGIVIGVSRGLSEPAAVEYAKTISDKTGAGLVIAYGFAAQRVTVAQPLVFTSPIDVRLGDAQRPGSIYAQYRAHLLNAGHGPIKFYVGVRIAGDERNAGGIEVAASGLSFEQLKGLKAAFNRIRDSQLNGSGIAKVDIALNPLDDISWSPTGVKNHGVLMLAEKGVILRLPKTVARAPAKDVYIKILTTWVSEALSISLRNPSRLPEIRADFLPLGRIDSFPSRSNARGVVIAAPHGSFDRHTGEVVQALSYRTGFAAVITRGFTPTEAGGWRINVNRPTERRYPEHETERGTERSQNVYRRFTEAVIRAAGGPVELYFDIHQSSSQDHIDVATVGISVAEARAIKSVFDEIRDRVLAHQVNLPRVELLIEPLDKVMFTALGAKRRGILRWARRGLHIELPAHRILYSSRLRRTYTAILADLIAYISAPAFGRMPAGATEISSSPWFFEKRSVSPNPGLTPTRHPVYFSASRSGK